MEHFHEIDEFLETQLLDCPLILLKELLQEGEEQELFQDHDVLEVLDGDLQNVLLVRFDEDTLEVCQLGFGYWRAVAYTLRRYFLLDLFVALDGYPFGFIPHDANI